MASVKDFTPTPEQLQGQKLGGEKLSETAFTKQPVAPAPKQTGGVTSKVSSFTPTAEELAAQRYETVGAQGGKPLAKIVTAEKVAKNPPLPAIEAPELKASLQRGIEPRSTLSLAPEQAPKFEMPPVKGGYENIPQQKAGIFKTRPSSVTPLGVPVGEPYVKSQSRALAVIPQPKPEPTFTEKMGQGAKYSPPPKPEPTMGERMSASAGYTPPKVDPYTGQVIKESAPLGARIAEAGRGIISGFKGVAQKVLAPVAGAAPMLNVAGAQAANEAAMQSNVQRLAAGETETPVSTKGSIEQEIALQAMRDPMFAMKALSTAMGAGQEAKKGAEGQKPAATAQQPATPEQPAKPAPMSTQDTNLAAGAQLPGGGTVGTQEPVIDFSQRPATVPLKQGQTEMQRGTEIEKTAQERGQAVSKGAGGNFRYVQGPNGTVVKQNIDTGEVVPMSVQGITSNVLKPGEESPLAREVKERKAAQAEAKEAAFRDALLRMAQDQGDGTFTGMGQAKRNRKLATQLLAQMDNRNQAAAQLGMEEKKLASTERATAATQEQNRLYREQQAADKKTELGLKERQVIAAEEAAKNKTRKEMFGEHKLEGSPQAIAAQKIGYGKQDYVASRFKALKDDYGPEEAKAKAGEEYGNILNAYVTAFKKAQSAGNADDMKSLSAELRGKIGVTPEDYLQSLE